MKSNKPKILARSFNFKNEKQKSKTISTKGRRLYKLLKQKLIAAYLHTQQKLGQELETMEMRELRKIANKTLRD